MKMNAFFLVLLILSIAVCNGDELKDLSGSWKCTPFSNDKNGIKFEGNGIVHFQSNSNIQFNLDYRFNFDELGFLSLSISLNGKWIPTVLGFDSSYDRVEINVLENSTSFSDDEAKDFLRDYYVIDGKESYKVEFISSDSILWHIEKHVDAVACSRLVR